MTQQHKAYCVSLDDIHPQNLIGREENIEVLSPFSLRASSESVYCRGVDLTKHLGRTKHRSLLDPLYLCIKYCSEGGKIIFECRYVTISGLISG